MNDLFKIMDEMVEQINQSFATSFDDSFFREQNQGIIFDKPQEFRQLPRSPRDEMLSQPEIDRSVASGERRDIDLDKMDGSQRVAPFHQGGRGFAGIFADMFGGMPSTIDGDLQTHIFSRSRIFKSIKTSDGNYEETTIERDADGKETKTVVKKMGDEMQRFVSKTDSKSGESETHEEFYGSNNDMMSHDPAVVAEPINVRGGWLSRWLWRSK